MLRQLGRPLHLDRGHGLKDPLINTHPSSLLSFFYALLPASLPRALGGIEAGEKMECPTTSTSERASTLTASSFVLLEGGRRLSPLSVSSSVQPIFFVLHFSLDVLSSLLSLYAPSDTVSLTPSWIFTLFIFPLLSFIPLLSFSFVS